jgi:tetratricopeptide (TPR) repeat protein
LELAYLKGFLSEQRELRNLANFYLYMQLPQRAAVLLEHEIGEGRVSADARTLVTLAEAQYRANDLGESVATLLRAAARFDDPSHYFRAAELQIQLEQWDEAAESLELALREPAFVEAARARLMLGIANYERGDVQGAQQSFEIAGRDESTRTQAQQWLQYLRETQLAERATE